MITCDSFILTIFVILCLCSSQDTVISTVHDRIFTAFVFAGSARSFITPFVRKSIQKNVITSFCPQETCIPHIFVRISSNDNKHGGTDAIGSLTIGSIDLKHQIDDCLRSIEPSTESQGKLYRIFAEIGSEQEKIDMKDFGQDNMYHKVYRYL